MRALVHTALFLCVVVILQVVVGWYFVVRHAKLAAIDGAMYTGAEVLLFGDSVMRWPLDRDTDRRTIPTLLGDLDRGTHVIADLSDPSNHLGLYEAMVSYLVSEQYRPRAIIVPINMETFSPGVDLRPEYQAERDTFLLTTPVPLARYFYQPLAVFGAVEVNSVSYAEYYGTPIFDRGTRVGTVGMFDDPHFMERGGPDASRLRFVYQYGYDLTPGHRKLQSLRNLLTYAAGAGIRVFVYVSPLNHEGAEKTVGVAFADHIQDNIDVACAAVRAFDVPCLNLAFSLDASHFETPTYPGSHLDITGREFLARALYDKFIAPNAHMSEVR